MRIIFMMNHDLSELSTCPCCLALPCWSGRVPKVFRRDLQGVLQRGSAQPKTELVNILIQLADPPREAWMVSVKGCETLLKR